LVEQPTLKLNTVFEPAARVSAGHGFEPHIGLLFALLFLHLLSSSTEPTHDNAIIPVVEIAFSLLATANPIIYVL
jgi:hypothetical protein